MAGEAHLGEARQGEKSRARLGSGWDPREKGIVFASLVWWLRDAARVLDSWSPAAAAWRKWGGGGAYYWRDWIRADAGEEKGEGNWRRRAIYCDGRGGGAGRGWGPRPAPITISRFGRRKNKNLYYNFSNLILVMHCCQSQERVKFCAIPSLYFILLL